MADPMTRWSSRPAGVGRTRRTRRTRPVDGHLDQPGVLEGGHELPEGLLGHPDPVGRATAEEVAWGYVASLAVRAGFTSLPFERLGEPPTPALAATFGERAALTRVIADLALALPPA
jgi:hypothetical protein